MTLLITIAALLVIATIVASLSAASGLQKQRRQLADLLQGALEAEQNLEEVEGHRKTVAGSEALHTTLRDEKLKRIEQLNEELKHLKEERVAEREIKVAGSREKSSSLNDKGGSST